MKLLFLLLVGILLIGCVEDGYSMDNTKPEVIEGDGVTLQVEKYCDEGIVCYSPSGRYPLSCFDSESPVFEKYC